MFATFCPKKKQIDPLYTQIANYLKSEILSGKFPDNQQLPPEPELATMLGTSRITLRKGLKQLEKQHLIIQKKGMGTFVTYRPDRCYRIALAGLSHGAPDMFSMQIISGLQQAFSRLRHELIFLYRQQSVTLRDQVHAANADALIFTTPRDGDLAELADPFFSEFPQVLINIHPENAPGKLCVDATSDPMREALEHLHAAGHRRIGYVTLPNVTSNVSDRNKSFRENLVRCGLAEFPELIQILPRGATFDNGCLGTKKLLSLPEPPDAIVIVGLTLSLGAWQAVMETHRRIPQDIAMVGYDVPPWVNPRFSTILQPHEKVAEHAGNLLIRWLNGETELKSKTFDVHFEDRGSIFLDNEHKTGIQLGVG